MWVPSLFRKSGLSILGTYLSSSSQFWSLISSWHCCDGIEIKPSSKVTLLMLKGQTLQHPGWLNSTSFLLVQDLKEWVAVESDSIQPDLRKEVIRMMALAADRLVALGAIVNLVNLGSHQVLVWFLHLKHHICTYDLPIAFSAMYMHRHVMTYWYFWLLNNNLSVVP